MTEAAVSKTNTYTIDPNHSAIHFWVRHMMVAKVHGELSDIVGQVSYDPAKPETATLDVTIDARTLTTRNDQRDGHLKSADFFDVEKYPEITFKSTGIRSTGGGGFDVTGDLTIHGVTKPVTFEAEVTPEVTGLFGAYVVGITASGIINREDFGMSWNQALEAGGVLVGKEIHFQIDGELNRPL